MTPSDIRSLRLRLGENTADFAARMGRSGRTVEDWEQGRRNPDPLAVAEMARISASISTTASRKSKGGKRLKKS